MRRIKRAAVLRNCKKKLRISRKVRVVNLKNMCGIDQIALCVLAEIINPALHACLFNKVCNVLLGFDAHVQVVMVEALKLYISDGVITVTDIETVDCSIVNLNHLFDRLLQTTLNIN